MNTQLFLYPKALIEEVVHQNITDKQWIATEAWISNAAASVPHNLPSLVGTIGFALRKADIPGLGPFLTRPSPSLISQYSDPFLKELWESLFGCSLRAGLLEQSSGPPCSGSEVIGEKS